MRTSLLHFVTLTPHTLNLTELYHPYGNPVTHSGLDWNLLNPPSRCLPLSCWSDGQEYWVVLFETGLWQRDVGSFRHQFLRVVLNAGGSCFPCQVFEAGMHELLCQFFTATIPSAFSPAWVFTTYSCHLIPIPAGSTYNLIIWNTLGGISNRSWTDPDGGSGLWACSTTTEPRCFP